MSVQYIYLARHGQTASNASGTSQGIDSILNETGHTQAAKLANRAKHIRFETLHSSPYERAKQTVQYIAEAKDMSVTTHDFLREVKNPSHLVGVSRTSEEYQQYLNDKFESFIQGEWEYKYADEESFGEVIERVKETVNLFNSLQGNAFIVSHGHFLRYLICYVLTDETLDPITWRRIGFSMNTSNTGITILRRETASETWKLHTFNDLAHFADN